MGYLPQIVIYRSWYTDKIEPMLNEENRNKACVMQRCINDEVKYFIIDINEKTIEHLQEIIDRNIDRTAVAVGIICPNIFRDIIYHVFETVSYKLKKLNVKFVGGYFNDGRAVTLIDNENA